MIKLHGICSSNLSKLKFFDDTIFEGQSMTDKKDSKYVTCLT